MHPGKIQGMRQIIRVRATILVIAFMDPLFYSLARSIEHLLISLRPRHRC